MSSRQVFECERMSNARRGLDSRPHSLPLSVKEELMAEFQNCDSSTTETMIKLYEVCWYLEARNHPEEALHCAIVISGLRRSILQRG